MLLIFGLEYYSYQHCSWQNITRSINKKIISRQMETQKSKFCYHVLMKKAIGK